MCALCGVPAEELFLLYRRASAVELASLLFVAIQCHIIEYMTMNFLMCISDRPHQKLLGDGFFAPVPLLCLICTIISNKTGIFD